MKMGTQVPVVLSGVVGAAPLATAVVMVEAFVGFLRVIAEAATAII
jgi:hypothetical protein